MLIFFILLQLKNRKHTTMATLRFQALAEVMRRTPNMVSLPSFKVSDYYGENVFGKETMSRYLSKDAYKAVNSAIDKGTLIDRKVASSIAAGMKA